MTIWCSAQADLPKPVAQALARAGIPDTHVGVVVAELDGTPLLRHGDDRALNPASVMKLVTTLAALDTWGPAHAFKTLVWLDGGLKDGVLQGNLVLQGGGDPGMTPERFWSLLRELRLRGLKEIRGDVLLDNGLYAIQAEDPGAFDQAPLRPYNAQPAPLLVNHNARHLRLCPRAAGVEARLDPDAALPRLDNRLRSSQAACDAGAADLDLRLEGDALVLEGQLPDACGPRTLALNLAPPRDTAAAWFATLWRESGGSLAGQIRTGAPGPDARPWLAFDSPPLAQLVRDVNKHSNNVMAKMLFLNLGAARLGAPATWEKGERALRDWLGERGLVLPGLVLRNGSGLSRLERATAAGLADLLAWAARQPLYYEFAASLPAAGLEGTQKRRFNGQGPTWLDATGQAWLKSGSLNGVRNLAGYVQGPGGTRRVLVFLVNHSLAPRAEAAQEALLDWARTYTKTAAKDIGEEVNQQ